jgi:Mov34/MPN/PAD-1 family.
MLNKVYITSYCLETIKLIIKRHNQKTEIGGVLVGFQKRDSLTIIHASDPGPNAIMQHNWIKIDEQYTTEFCNYLNKLSNNSLYYLGDWHTHLSSNLLPSPTDYKAVQTLASYLPEDARFSLITVIFNHFSPDIFKVYNYSQERLLKEVECSII